MAINQVGDGSSDGVEFPNTKLGFYGATPVAQPAGNAQVAIARGVNASIIATYGTTQSPSAVAANTAAEAAFTVQTGTGFTMQPIVGDVVYVNKPTSQAGLGVGNVRVSASNTVNVNFANYTAGSITPTASQVYTIVALRGIPTVSAVLSPISVPAASTQEQTFTVVGLPVGALVQVSKPTAQAGLDIVGCRVVSNNVLGITFANPTAAAILPTAAETYIVNALYGLDALNNTVTFGFNVGTVGAIGPGIVITGGSTTLTGILASDVTLAVFKPTAQAAATNAAAALYGIPTTNTLTLYFLGIGTGATPTASEVYEIPVFRISPAAPLVVYTPTLAPVAVAANTTAEQTFTVTGLIASSAVWVNKVTSFTNGLGIAGVRVSAANTLAVTYVNATASSITPPSEPYVVGNFQVLSPGAGNSVAQTVSAFANGTANLVNALQSALNTTNLIAGV